MPLYLVYKGRKCGSTARGTDVWTKTELLTEAKLQKVSTTGNMTDICKRLIDHDKGVVQPHKIERQEMEGKNRQAIEKEKRQATEKKIKEVIEKLKREVVEKKMKQVDEKKQPVVPLIYRGKRCGTHERGHGTWTRATLVAEAKLHNIPVTGTMDEICRRLIDEGEPPKKGPIVQHVPPKPIVAQKKKSKNTKNCKNDTNVLGDELDEMTNDEIIQDIYGYCYTPDELISTLENSKRNENPYTRQPFWLSRASFDKLFNHSGFTDVDRAKMIAIFYPTFDHDIINLVKSYPDIYNLIGMTGVVLKSDYGQDFKASASMLGELTKELDKLAEPIKKKFKDLKTFGGNKTLNEIIEDSNLSCIHGVGSDILGIYLYIWFNIPEIERPPLIDPLYRSSANDVIVLGYTHEQGQYFDLYLFKFDPNIDNIISINYLTIVVSRGVAVPSNGHNILTSKVPADVVKNIRENVIDNIDEITIKYGLLREYLSNKGFENL